MLFSDECKNRLLILFSNNKLDVERSKNAEME